LDEVFQPELDQLVATMAASNIRIRIIGHTDNSGTKTFNQALSENRARSVADFLLQNGIKQSRMETSGRGADSPIASNDSETGRSSNRRTEIVIVE
jgi:outer membrane protein OmpA-like peptidoglycan-associated protein